MTRNASATVLIVDDEPANIRILVELLKDLATLRTATTGDRAIDLALAEPPDLILLDVGMPGLDGWETCLRLKADPKTREVPVIFITARQTEADELRGFEVGAVDYVTKPFRPVVVRARVKTHLELKDLRDGLAAESRLDPLTGIANRRRFEEGLESAWEFAVRDRTPLSLVLIDIDQFKEFNDAFGHPEGDVCLRRVAGALAGATRRKVDLLARWGGEEFACLLPVTPPDGALHRAEVYRASIPALEIPTVAGAFLSISQGVATLQPRLGDRPGLLVEAADRALYQAKSSGRNCVRVWES